MKTVVLETSDGHRLTLTLRGHRVTFTAGSPCATRTRSTAATGSTRSSTLCSTALPAAGFAAIRFDFRADYDNGRGERLDVIAALDALSGELGEAVPLFAVGYSFGAMVTLTTVDERISARVVIAPPIVESLAAPDSPVLVLVARHDQFAPAERITEATADWPGVEIEVIEVGRPLPRRPHRRSSPSGRPSGSALGWVIDADHPGRAEAVGAHPEARRPEGLLERHVDRSAVAECPKMRSQSSIVAAV